MGSLKNVSFLSPEVVSLSQVMLFFRPLAAAKGAENIKEYLPQPHPVN
jgi:hypothetical protein